MLPTIPVSRGAVTVRVDNTAPGAVAIDIAGGPTWRNENDFDVGLDQPTRNRPRTDRRGPLPDLPTGGRRLHRGEAAGSRHLCRSRDLAVPGPGEWQVRVWREDAAANHEPANASVPVPSGSIRSRRNSRSRPTSASDPTLVSVAVSDRVSGLASGQIEVSRQGTGTWQSLATERQGDRLLARIDDSLLPAGVYHAPCHSVGSSLEPEQHRPTHGRRANGAHPASAGADGPAGWGPSERTVRRSVKRRRKAPHSQAARGGAQSRAPRCATESASRLSVGLRTEMASRCAGAEIQVLLGQRDRPGPVGRRGDNRRCRRLQLPGAGGRNTDAAIRLLGNAGDAADGKCGQSLDLCRIDAPSHPPATHERPERSIFRPPARTSRRRRRASSSSCKWCSLAAGRPSVQRAHRPTGRGRSGTTSAAHVGCCDIGSGRDFRRRRAMRSRPDIRGPSP